MSFGSAGNQNYNDEMERSYGYNRLPQYEPLTKSAKEDIASENSVIFNLKLMTEGLRKRRGQYYGITMTLIQDAPSTYINFVYRGRNINAPANIVTPNMALFDLDVTNIGTGNLFYSINLPPNESGTAALTNGAFKRFKAQRPTWESITMRATGANVIVNLGFGL